MLITLGKKREGVSSVTKDPIYAKTFWFKIPNFRALLRAASTRSINNWVVRQRMLFIWLLVTNAKSSTLAPLQQNSKFVFAIINRQCSINNKRTCELAVHYNSFEHQICQISFIVIEQIVNHRNGVHLEQLQFTREAYWTSQPFSLHSHGLNKRREFKSKNRICYNSWLAFIVVQISLAFTTGIQSQLNCSR